MSAGMVEVRHLATIVDDDPFIGIDFPGIETPRRPGCTRPTGGDWGVFAGHLFHEGCMDCTGRWRITPAPTDTAQTVTVVVRHDSLCAYLRGVTDVGLDW